MGFVEGETGSCTETCVMCDGDGTEEGSIEGEDTIDIKEEVSIKVEEAIDIKEEVGIKVEEAIDIKNEIPEVRLRGVFEVVVVHAFRPFIVLQERKLCNYTSLFPALGYIVGAI
jgi:hypothetical protein